MISLKSIPKPLPKWVYHFSLSNKMGEWQLIISWQQVTCIFFLKIGVHGLRFSLQNVLRFFCLDPWVVSRTCKSGWKNDFREYRSKITFVFLTTDKTITHKLFHSLRSSFCVVTAIVLVATQQREDLHLLRNRLSLLSLLWFVILTFHGTQRQGKLVTLFWLV